MTVRRHLCPAVRSGHIAVINCRKLTYLYIINSIAMKRKLGCFVSVAGGLETCIERGGQLGLDTIMIHPSPPQRWCAKPFKQEAIDAFNDKKKTSTIKSVFMHGIYLSNLAHPDKQKWHLGKLSLAHYMQLAEAIGSDGVMFHTGSLKDTTEEVGFPQVAKSLDWILEKAPGESIIMMEVAAGAGNVIGDRFEELAKIYEMVENKDRVFFCLDSQHMWASGYDIANELDSVVDELDRILGIENVRCVHLNDSKTELGSNRDRHENLGEGLIGEEGIKGFLNHPKTKTSAILDGNSSSEGFSRGSARGSRQVVGLG